MAVATGSAIDVWSYLTVVNVLLLIVGGGATWLARSYYRFKVGWKNGPNVPGPPANYPLGGAQVFVDHGRFYGWMKALEMGDPKAGMARVYGGGNDYTVVTHHDDLRKILQVSPHHFGKNVANPFDDRKSWFVYRIGRKSVIFHDANRHNEWRFLRRVIGKAFLTTAVRPLVRPTVDTIQPALDYLSSKADTGKAYDITEFFSSVSFDILGKCAFSEDFGAVDHLATGGKIHPLVSSFKVLNEQSKWRTSHLHPFYEPRFLWIPTKMNREAQKQRALMVSEATRIIRKRRKIASESDGSGPAPAFRNFIDILLSEEDTLTEEQLRANAITIMLAGHETTTRNLVHTVYLLAQHPEAQEKIQQEVDRVLPPGTPLDATNVKQLEYTSMVLKEALRMHPGPFLTVRSIPKAMDIGGYHLPKDTNILVHMGIAMRDPYNWDDPDTFKPERFSKENESENFYAFLPFMHGGRNCIGQRFAQMTTVCIIASLVRRFEFKLPEDFEYVIEVTNNSSTVPKGGMPLFVRERTQQRVPADE